MRKEGQALPASLHDSVTRLIVDLHQRASKFGLGIPLTHEGDKGHPVAFRLTRKPFDVPEELWTKQRPFGLRSSAPAPCPC